MPREEDDYVDEILRLEKPLRAFLHRFAPQSADLDDLLQETYSHLFRLSPERRRAVQNLHAFVIASARNVAMDWIRHRQVVSIESLDDLGSLPLIDAAAELDEIVHTHQQLTRIAEGIGRLPERCRQVFTLRRIYGLSQKEIARKFGISEGAVEQLLIRSMRRCAELLGPPPEDDARTRKGKPARWIGRLRGKLGVEE
jgi:RNA polymerase sigma factor (sigma-70 family)